MKAKLTILFLLFATTMVAQELTVKSFALDETDLSARTNQVPDANGEPCALVKVGLVIPNAEFEGYKVKVVPKTSEYWVYMIDDAREIKVTAPGVLPFEFNFPEPLKRNCTYKLLLSVPDGYVLPVAPVVTENAHENSAVTEAQNTQETTAVTTAKNETAKATMFYLQPHLQVGSLMGVGASVGVNLGGVNVELGGVKGLGKEEYFAYRADGTEIGKSAFDATALEAKIGYKINVAEGFAITPQVGASMLAVSDGLLVENANAISGIAGVRVSYSLARNFALFATPSLNFKLTESDGYKHICEKVDNLSKWSSGFNLKVGLSVEF